MAQGITLKWTGDTTFETEINGFVLKMTEGTSSPHTIDNPKKIMLVSLMGCTAFDVVSLLRKMRVTYTSFEISVAATQTEEHPRIYRTVHLIYFFKGDNIAKNKVEKAVKLSQEKYCGVSEMFRRFAELTYEIRYN